MVVKRKEVTFDSTGKFNTCYATHVESRPMIWPGTLRVKPIIYILVLQACKHLLAPILMLLEGNKACDLQTLPQVLQLGRTHTIAFIR